MMIELLLFIVFVTLSCFLLYDFFRNKYYSARFWFICVYLSWFFPQLLNVYQSSSFDESTKISFILYSYFCIVFFIVGNCIVNFKDKLFFNEFDEKKINFWLLIATTVASVSYLKARSVLDVYAELYGGHLTGFITILFFLSRIFIYTYAVSFYNFLDKRNVASFILMLPSLLYFLDRILIYGRRSSLAEFFIITTFILYFKCNKKVSKRYLIVGIVCAVMFIHGVGKYREIMSDPTKSLSEFSLVNSFQEGVTNVNASEALLAMAKIDYVYVNDLYDFGAEAWDRIVHSFIPGQLIGHDLKKYITLNYNTVTNADVVYSGTSGLTNTGFFDSFHAFSFAGVLIFFCFGVFSKYLYVKACTNNYIFVIFYSSSLPQLLHTITHSTTHYIIEVISFNLFFGMYFLFFCKKGTGYVGNA
ncbi:oligosaccharide repeat unit polymerase [Escherichia coli]|nr:oligosaccharide repeat unit polymerase [Escherichia coli]EED0594534.1 oligosaccharide repeat unit polymerase [Escherichia coli]EES0431500.1 oligosaccharide repeat unit polymerase [Escherichia coli]EET1491584.1 oligosaccharide repeat unit polymerase [Escherichia coli]EEW8369076.1 oligosaccharide repeat unit polymerase [Escherichia coli]